MIKNTATTWGAAAKLLHWAGAILIFLLLGHGWWMVNLAPRADRLAHYAGHSALGYDFLALLVIRLVWRWMNAVPALPEGLAPWTYKAAHASHMGLYALMLLATVTGWALAGTFAAPLDAQLLGFIPVPAIVSNRELHGTLEEGHAMLSWALAALVVVHIAAALHHHFIKRNAVLKGMI